MNRALKYFGILSAGILTQHLANSAYLGLMNMRFKARAKADPNELIYQWRFGHVRYKIVGDGEPLLLIHGIYPGADMSEWRGIAPEILNKYKVYAIDLLGFGHSEKPNLSYSAYLYIRLINDFIRDVIKEAAITVASDYSAAYTIMGYVFDPLLYKKLLLISPTGINDGYSLPRLEDLAFKMFMELPVLGTSAYLLLTDKYLGNTMLNKLSRTRSITGCAPDSISSSAFIGGANARFPISALFSKYLNVGVKHKLTGVQIPTLTLPRDQRGLKNAAISPELIDFLELKRNTR